MSWYCLILGYYLESGFGLTHIQDFWANMYINILYKVEIFVHVLLITKMAFGAHNNF